MSETSETKCEICGEPMPAGEEMFKYHGYSGPCPKPPALNQPIPYGVLLTEEERIVLAIVASEAHAEAIEDTNVLGELEEDDPHELTDIGRELMHESAHAAAVINNLLSRARHAQQGETVTVRREVLEVLQNVTQVFCDAYASDLEQQHYRPAIAEAEAALAAKGGASE